MWMQAADRLHSQQCRCGTTAVELTQEDKKTRNIWTNNPRSISYHSTASTLLLVQDTFQMIIHSGCYVVNGQNEPLLHKILHTHTKHFVHVRCVQHPQVISGLRINHILSTNGGIKFASLPMFGLAHTTRVAVMGHNCYLIYDITIL